MKLKIISILLLISVSCSNETAIISFEKEIIDIGSVEQDSIVNIFFRPKNIGKKRMEIKSVRSDCHCTVARDFQKFIEPDREGEIKITYHGKGLGYFEQLIEVFSNADNSPSLMVIKGRVVMPD